MTCQRSIFGFKVRYWQRNGSWWWRGPWHRKRRSVGPYQSRTLAIRDSVRLLYSVPHLKKYRA